VTRRWSGSVDAVKNREERAEDHSDAHDNGSQTIAALHNMDNRNNMRSKLLVVVDPTDTPYWVPRMTSLHSYDRNALYYGHRFCCNHLVALFIMLMMFSASFLDTAGFSPCAKAFRIGLITVFQSLNSFVAPKSNPVDVFI